MTSIDDEWSKFLCDDDYMVDNIVENPIIESGEIPVCEELYISTKTKVLYLNQPIDINNIFWKLPIIDYGLQKE